LNINVLYVEKRRNSRSTIHDNQCDEFGKAVKTYEYSFTSDATRKYRYISFMIDTCPMVHSITKRGQND